MSFLDIEAAVLDRVAGLGVTTTTRLPAAMAGQLPLIRARRLGGVDERWQVAARVVVECYAGSRSQVWQVAEDAALLLLPGFVSSGGTVVDTVRSDAANAELPYADSDIRVVVGTYVMVARRAPALL